MDISVVVPVYNGEKYLRETLDSILAQETRAAFEVIVVDDGSNDRTPEILEQYVGRFPNSIRIISGQRAGNVKARNTAIELSSAEWIAFCDADDTWLPRKLDIQLAAMQDTDWDACCAATVLVRADGRSIAVKGADLSDEGVTSRLLTEAVMPVPLSGWLVRRLVLQTLGGLDESFPVGADFDLAWRIARSFKVRHVREPLVRYRLHSNSITAERLKHQQLVRAYVRARGEGRTGDRSFTEWASSERRSRRERVSDFGARRFRLAGHHLSDGRALLAAAEAALALVTSPRHVVSRLRGYGFRS